MFTLKWTFPGTTLRISAMLTFSAFVCAAAVSDTQIIGADRRGFTQPATDTVHRDYRGSLTRLCRRNGDEPNRVYYLTSSHVMDCSDGLTNTVGENAKIERRDSRTDLVEISALGSPEELQKAHAEELLGPAGSFFRRDCVRPVNDLTFELPSAYFPTAVGGSTRRMFRTEVLDLEVLSRGGAPVQAREWEGYAISSRVGGISGREGLWNPIVVTGRSIGGYSGAPVFVKDRETYSFLGIIASADPQGRETTLIPAEVIENFFRTPRNRNIQPQEREVSQGVQYLDTGAVHFRSGSTGPGGPSTGPGGPSTSRNSCSTPPFPGYVPFSSGIVTRDQPGQRWLSLDDPASAQNIWSEGEPFPTANRSLLAVPSRLQGLFERDRALYSTSTRATLPRFFEGYPSRGLLGCSRQRWSVDAGDGSSGSVRDAVVCIKHEGNVSSFALVMPGVKGKFEVYRIELSRRSDHCEPGISGGCPVVFDARRFTISGARNGELPPDCGSAFESRVFNDRSSLPLCRTSQSPLTHSCDELSVSHDGIRNVTFSNAALYVSLTGGVRFEERAVDRVRSVWSGPMVQAGEIERQDLLANPGLRDAMRALGISGDRSLFNPRPPTCP